MPKEKSKHHTPQNIALSSNGTIPVNYDDTVNTFEEKGTAIEGGKKNMTWEELELKYVTGYDTIKKILNDAGLKETTGYAFSKTGDWKEKRATYRREMLAEKEEQIKEIQKAALASIELDLYKIAPSLMPHMADYIQKAKKRNGLTPMEAKTIFDMIRVVASLPTVVTQNNNLDGKDQRTVKELAAERFGEIETE